MLALFLATLAAAVPPPAPEAPHPSPEVAVREAKPSVPVVVRALRSPPLEAQTSLQTENTPVPLGGEVPAEPDGKQPEWWVWVAIAAAAAAGIATATFLALDDQGGPSLQEGTGAVRGTY